MHDSDFQTLCHEVSELNQERLVLASILREMLRLREVRTAAEAGCIRHYVNARQCSCLLCRAERELRRG